MERISHNLSDMVSQLSTKIAVLETGQSEIADALSRNVNVEVNTAALQQVAKSLAAAQVALAALQLSCCNQGCEIDWDKPVAAAD